MSAQAGPSKPRSKKGPKKPLVKSGKVKKITEKQKIDALEKAATEFVSPVGIKAFIDLPLSDPTKRGLKKAFFVDMTDIQSKSLPVSLKGKDVLGAARTGSGKTLAFLVPVLEMLYRKKWGPADGLGALIISPTRELAVQIFEVLRSIGGYHTFSAGLVIGGKNLKDEKDRLSKMNILVATPGRLLQHMDQTVGFESDNLQLLVLDEADRILDMGFSRTLTALLSHLPKTRQTLLFSATQTESVTDLARLSLKYPVQVGVKELNGPDAGTVMPKNLEQHYAVVDLDKKLDVLWSFIKTHLQSKVLVFMSSCKQVRFVFETFCKMHPGVPLLHMHGKQKQTARLEMYSKFTSMSHAILFATDIAARGLDFPSVNWVVQVDAPEDADTYIHRVGRTARYESAGKALLLLLPSEEEGMKAALKKKKIEVQKIKIRASKTHSIENQLQNLAFQDPEIKYLGQRAFVSYMRSIYLHKDKDVFKIEELPAARFAESLGLPGMPKIKFLSKEIAKKQKNASRTVLAAQVEVAKEAVSSEDEDEDEDDEDGETSEEEEEPTSAAVAAAVEESDGSESDEDEEDEDEEKKTGTKPNAVRTKYDRMFERKNQNILSEHYTKLIDHSPTGSDAEGDDFITLVREDHELPDDNDQHLEDNLSKRKLKMNKAKRMITKFKDMGKKITFDDEGNPHELYEMQTPETFFKDGLAGANAAGKKFAEEERGKMMETDVIDRQEAKQKKQEKKRKRKEREKGGDDGAGGTMVDAMSEDDDGYVSPVFDIPSAGSDDDEDEYPAAKRNKYNPSPSPPPTRKRPSQPTIEDDEELALSLLRR